MFSLVNLRVTFKAQEDINFPLYSGSAFRGLFGKSLRKISCLAKKETCMGCGIFATCPYATIFENGQRAYGSHDEVPNPYVIEPLPLGKKNVKKGELFSFNCILYGTATEKLSYVILAWIKAGKMGFTTEHSLAQLIRIEQVCADANLQLIYDVEQSSALLQNVDSTYFFPEARQIKKIHIILQTPLRIHHQGHPVVPDQFTAQDFLISLLRRQENMAKYHITNYPLLNYEEIKNDIANVRITSSNLHWCDWARYSSRQQKRIALGGIVGDFVLQGDLSQLYSYIKLGEVFHLGKSAVLGMGKYCIKEL